MTKIVLYVLVTMSFGVAAAAAVDRLYESRPWVVETFAVVGVLACLAIAWVVSDIASLAIRRWWLIRKNRRLLEPSFRAGDRRMTLAIREQRDKQ